MCYFKLLFKDTSTLYKNKTKTFYIKYYFKIPKTQTFLLFYSLKIVRKNKHFKIYFVTTRKKKKCLSRLCSLIKYLGKKMVCLTLSLKFKYIIFFYNTLKRKSRKSEPTL
jgi:hypothetical protein